MKYISVVDTAQHGASPQQMMSQGKCQPHVPTVAMKGPVQTTPFSELCHPLLYNLNVDTEHAMCKHL